MAYREQEQGNIISVTKKQYNDLNQGLSVKGYKKTKKDILVPSFKDIYSKGEMDSKIAQIVYCTNNNGNLSISDEELKKIVTRHNDHLILKMEDVSTRNIEILKLVAYSEQESQQGFFDYIFSNGESEINLTVNESGDVPVIDEFLLFGATVSKATYADYAIKNPNGSYSKFTHNSNGVLKVGDTHIVSKKRLLWSGEVDIGATDFIDIFTSSVSLKGKKLEIWVYDKGRNYMFEPITLKVNAPYGSAELFKKRFVDTDNLDVGIINSFELTLRYIISTNTFQGRCVQNQWNITNKTNSISALTYYYVTEIYEIIE